jgi:hypothetical protein
MLQNVTQEIKDYEFKVAQRHNIHIKCHQNPPSSS